MANIGDTMKLMVFIQARMSSTRFPGKMLAPFLGKPLIYHLVENVRAVVPIENICVLTSNQDSDIPLRAYLEALDINVFCGELNNVFERYRSAALAYGAGWIVRICGDSPLIDGRVIKHCLDKVSNDFDIVSNVFPRTFPKGQSVEIIKSSLFHTVNRNELTSEDMEHVTKYFYKNSSNYRIHSIKSNNAVHKEINTCVDTVEDLRRLENSHNSWSSTQFIEGN